MEQIEKALALALDRHQGQFRKDGRTPYILHPLRMLLTLVVDLRIEDPDLITACLLHDTIEDTATDYDDVAEISVRAADWVTALTDDKRLPVKERKKVYFDILRKAPPEVRLLKLVDLYDNLRDADNLSSGSRKSFFQKKKDFVEMLVELADPEHREFAVRVGELCRKQMAANA
jgi:guanosine-3',5'-bis(diphosphate) 3'-pyrophosphohydrolase